MHGRHSLAIAVTVAEFFRTSWVLAEGALTRGQVQVASGVDYGLYLGESIEGVPTPYGLGVNVRLGYTMRTAVYVGGEFNHFFGSAQRFPEYGDVEGSLSIVQGGLEMGYDVAPLGRHLVIRPKLGVGSATVSARLDVEGVTGSISESGIVLSVGAQTLLIIQPWFVTAEARYTRFSVDTKKLQRIPGVELEDEKRLDGVLLGAGAGFLF